MTDNQKSKREFLKTTAYVVPSILTLKAIPAFAGSGSGRGNNGVGNGEDPQPWGDPPVNDGPGTGPGNPGNNQGKNASEKLEKAMYERKMKVNSRKHD